MLPGAELSGITENLPEALLSKWFVSSLKKESGVQQLLRKSVKRQPPSFFLLQLPLSIAFVVTKWLLHLHT